MSTRQKSPQLELSREGNSSELQFILKNGETEANCIGSWRVANNGTHMEYLGVGRRVVYSSTPNTAGPAEKQPCIYGPYKQNYWLLLCWAIFSRMYREWKVGVVCPSGAVS